MKLRLPLALCLLFVGASCSSAVGQSLSAGFSGYARAYYYSQQNIYPVDGVNVGSPVDGPAHFVFAGSPDYTIKGCTTCNLSDAQARLAGDLTANFGALHADIFGGVYAEQPRLGAQLTGGASLSITDRMELISPSVPIGHLMTFHAHLQVDGQIDASMHAVDDAVGYGDFYLDLDTPGIPTPSETAHWAEKLVNQNGVIHSNLAPATIPLTLVGARNGQFFDWYLDMGLHVEMSGGTQNATSANASISGTFEANFSQTIKWGGIDSVVDDTTGEPIDDWSVISDSGFDYSRPYPVPEPSALVLAAIGGLMLNTFRRQSGI